VHEGLSDDAAKNIATMKKGAMAEAAAERLAGKNWLPTLLRPPASQAAISYANLAGSASAFPDSFFLGIKALHFGPCWQYIRSVQVSRGGAAW
jgi:hypothetical protein